ncbi:MAG: succinylglutamate desuccinylase/aspartoacylase family protein [Myxococcales bacterium]|nr:succinylglutamate desuccinylase/aspartoacylase family protein [Myxococcales bacterium]
MEAIEHPAKTLAEPLLADSLDLDALADGAVHRLRIALVQNALGRQVRVPAIVVKGERPGPVFGITSALHGNEVNGIAMIHRLLETFTPADLRGTVVAIPITNIPAYLNNTRRYPDGFDLNRLMPGKPHGTQSEIYANRLINRIVNRFEYHLDLHTASFGRINSLYIRADMTKPTVAEMSRILRPEIIVHNRSGDGTLRGAAQALGIHSVTVEIGNPQRFQADKVRQTRIGVRDLLEHLDMLDADHEQADLPTIECSRSYWLYVDRGGYLTVLPELVQKVARGERIAELYNEWGDLIASYQAPEDGVVVGKETNPVAGTGERILHLGVIGPPPSAT